MSVDGQINTIFISIYVNVYIGLFVCFAGGLGVVLCLVLRESQ